MCNVSLAKRRTIKKTKNYVGSNLTKITHRKQKQNDLVLKTRKLTNPSILSKKKNPTH